MQIFREEEERISTEEIIRSTQSRLLTERQLEVLRRRIGTGENETLEQIATDFNLTRERIRQIQAKATSHIPKISVQLQPLLHQLEERMLGTADPFLPDADVELIDAILGLLDEPGKDFVYLAIEKIILFFRATAPFCELAAPKLSFYVCALHPPIMKHIRVRKEVLKREREEREKNRTWSYKELAIHVLRQENGPLHWSEIVRRSEALGRRDFVHPGTLFNVLNAHSEFAKVESGTYALKEQGYEETEAHIDTIWKVVAENQSPMSYGQILHRLQSLADIKKTSVRMFLDLHPRFYRSVNGDYGLRALLPDRSEQTLRIPKNLIEDGKSFKRIESAIERGYHVEDMLDTDLEYIQEHHLHLIS